MLQYNAIFGFYQFFQIFIQFITNGLWGKGKKRSEFFWSSGSSFLAFFGRYRENISWFTISFYIKASVT